MDYKPKRVILKATGAEIVIKDFRFNPEYHEEITKKAEAPKAPEAKEPVAPKPKGRPRKKSTKSK